MVSTRNSRNDGPVGTPLDTSLRGMMLRQGGGHGQTQKEQEVPGTLGHIRVHRESGVVNGLTRPISYGSAPALLHGKVTQGADVDGQVLNQVVARVLPSDGPEA